MGGSNFHVEIYREICLKSCSKNQWQEKLKLVCKQPQVANLSLFKSLYREVKLDQTGRERQFFT